MAIQNFLKPRGWYLFSEKFPAKGKSGILVFALESERKDQDYSTDESFVECYFSLDGHVRNIVFGTGSEVVFDAILKRIGGLGYNVAPSKVDGGLFYKIYEGNGNVVELEIFKNRLGKKYYGVTLKDKIPQ